MRSRILYSLSALLIAGSLATGCKPLTDQEAEELAEQAATLEVLLTQTAAAAGPTAESQPTNTAELQPTATPLIQRMELEDPSGDVVACLTGQALPDGAPFIDAGTLAFSADETGLRFEVAFPETQDLATNFTIPGSFLGVLVLDNAQSPSPADPALGDLSLGLLRIDALWNGQSLDSRVFQRDESGSMVLQEIPVELTILDGNRLQYQLNLESVPEKVNAAGFAALSLDACDYAGLNFDFSSGSRGAGFAEISLDEIKESIAKFRNPIN